jgi:MoaA/NifB/PqqE/SkfB family radical SAM enzyme
MLENEHPVIEWPLTTRQRSTYEGYKTVDQIAEMQPARVVIRSGEDMRGDLEELIEYAFRRGLDPVLELESAASLTPAMIERFRRRHLGRIGFRLDDADPHVHDASHNTTGLFLRTISAFGWSAAAGFAVEINTVVTDDNASRLDKILDLVERLGVDAWNLDVRTSDDRVATFVGLASRRVRVRMSEARVGVPV